MNNSNNVQILRLTDDQEESATLVDLTKEMARDDIDMVWWAATNLSIKAMKEQDRHWLWEQIVGDYSQDSLHACVAVVSGQSYVEGAMAYQFNVKSVLEPTLNAVYIGWLATAPRNRLRLTSNPLYKWVGSVLTYLAVRESYLAGLGGRVFLESLPDQQTLDFYKNKGFVRTNPAQSMTGLIDHELPEAKALEWLRKKGDLP